MRAGMQVMARRGVAAATVGDIAAEAGVVPGTFYNHFPRREDLLDALVGTSISALQRTSEMIAAASDDPGERITASVTALLDEAGGDTVFGTFLLDLAAQSVAVRDALRDAAAELIAQWTHPDPVAMAPAADVADVATVDAVVGIALEALRSRVLGRTTSADTAATARLLRRVLGVTDVTRAPPPAPLP